MIHHVYANRSNAGDWLSAIGIQRLLDAGEVREHLCDGPFVDETLAQLKACGAEDLIVIGGGGLFMAYFEPFWRGMLPIARRVPCVIWGVGACDTVNSPSLPSQSLIQEFAATCRLCVVRDGLTRDFIAQPGLPAPVACPTINALDADPPPSSGIILHADHYNNVGPENFERMEQFARDFAQATGRQHRKTNNTLPAGKRDALERVIDLYTSADLVLTSRLHGCIIAAALGRPFLAVSGDRKVDSFMHAAGLQRWLCTLDSVETIPARLAELDRERPTASAFVRATREANRRVASHIRELASGPSHRA